MLKNKNAITLIALVVTIVVLLILAGVSISLILDNNGIIAKSKDARLKSRMAQVEDEVGLWKQQNFINKESNQTQEEADAILESLISRNLLKEDEIDREQGIITIKKSDGSILKQISYSPITINISKYPETEKSWAVLLTVDSVEGITIPNFYIYNRDWSEVEDYLKTINKEQKKEMIKEMLPKSVNKEFETDECDTLEKALNKIALEIEGYGILDTEEKLWNCLEKEDEYDGFLMELCIEPLCLNNVDETTDIIEGYTVTNPDNEEQGYYIAAENGTYTFKIKDIVTGKTYTKKVEVKNVDESIKDKYQVVNSPSKYVITLQNKETSELANFSKAYIIVEGELKDISEIIKIDESQNYNYIWSNNIPAKSFGIADNEEYEFILFNDEGAWKGKAVVQREKY